jgi:hypothetical protein
MSQIDWFVVEDQLTIEKAGFTVYSFSFGWGNGYVAVPPGHPWYGRTDIYNVFISHEISFANHGDHLLKCPVRLRKHWILGFHTKYYLDLMYPPKKEDVIRETVVLYAQAFLEEIKSNGKEGRRKN